MDPLPNLKTKIIAAITGILGLLLAFGAISNEQGAWITANVDTIAGVIVFLLSAMGVTLHLKVSRDTKKVMKALSDGK